MAEPVVIGIDAGGTFTDFLMVEFAEPPRIRIHKTLSTPDAPERAILQGLHAMGLDARIAAGDLAIIHGSTVATNAVLERKLARTAFITNRGFRDMLTLARQTRPSLYQLQIAPQSPPVPAELCLETGGRLAADGTQLEPLTAADLQQLLAEIEKLSPEAVAVNLLFSFRDASNEVRIAEALQERFPELVVSRSSAVLPEYKEYERGIATWINAALSPVIRRYLHQLRLGLGRCSLQIMQSSGQTLAAEQAADSAARLLLSGPAGGLAAIQFLGRQLGETRLISFDMGGTSTDVALIDGAVAITNEGRLANFPIAVPMVDMHTIGAGGGSIAFVDAGGLLQVGPRSAGAQPGPACYGQGGREATVTDANLVLGHLVADTPLAGDLRLDMQLARDAIAGIAMPLGLSVEETARGIVRIANEHMAEAIRHISVYRGHDPREFTLASFGGAGGLHVCALAEIMGIAKAVVPVNGGVLSALGMVVAKPGRQFSRTVGLRDGETSLEQLQGDFALLQQQAREELLAEGAAAANIHCDFAADLRYLGQSYTLTVPWQEPQATLAAFQQQHTVRYGYSLEEEVEWVNLRVHAWVEQQQLAALPNVSCNISAPVEVYPRVAGVPVVPRAALPAGGSLPGPAVISEYAATTFVAPGWEAMCDPIGNLLLRRVTT